MKTLGIVLVVALAAACGSVSPAGSVREEMDGEMTAGMTGSAGAGTAGAAGTSADAGAEMNPKMTDAMTDAGADLGTSPDATCAAPALAVSWAISDAGSLAPVTCAAAGVADVRVFVEPAIAGQGSWGAFSVVLPCEPSSAAIPLAGRVPAGAAISYRAVAEGPNYSDARAAWVVGAARSGVVPACGALAAHPFQVAAGAPPSCAPCSATDTCCVKKIGQTCGPAGGTYSASCEGQYGAARADALAACQMAYQQFGCP